jgi:hypothetical protein
VVSATEARKRVEQLKAEKVLVWKALWLKRRSRSAQLHPSGVTVRKLLKIRRLCRVLLSEAPELPCVQRTDIGTKLTAPGNRAGQSP